MSEPSRPRGVPASMSVFVASGAFLLFALEPMVGRLLLPRFGGAFHVWTTSLMFFQGALVLAYAYAHLAAKRLGAWHFVVLALPLGFFPLGASPLDAWLGVGGRTSEDASIGALILALARTSLVPFFALATTSVVAQDWLARSPSHAGSNAYVLYSVSNVGSLAALFVYALAIEPWLGLRVQTLALSGGYAAYLLAAAIAYRRTAPHARPGAIDVGAGSATGARQLYWVLLSAWPSALLMAVTNVVTVDAGNVPLLWILPLAVYLLTFILAFSDRARTPDWVRRVWPHFAVVGVFFFAGGNAGSPLFHVLLQLGVLFVVGWAVHAELYAKRPDPAHLTRFYLLVSLGGWLGGAFVALLAPFVFTGLWEYPIAMLGLALTVAAGNWDAFRAWLRGAGKLPIVVTVALLAAIGWKLAEGMGSDPSRQRILEAARSPYGVYHVVQRPSALGTVRDLVSGETRHGRQVIEGDLRREPLSYYHREGPLGDVMAILAARPAPPGVRRARSVGAIGLGVGAIAAYLEPGESLDMYEIDALDVRLAETHFHFLGDARGEVRMHVGDARLTLEREAAEGARRRFDVLLVDAFAGDAIPTHLLTEEAVRVYDGQLRSGGILLFHVSNRFYELRPVLARVAEAVGYRMVWKQRGAGEVAREAGVVVEDPSLYVAMWPIQPGDDRWGPALEARGWRPFDARGYRDPGLFRDDYAPSLRALRVLMR
ncbi:MAG: fused MFS/spermidine synthase [Sandaracinaceae bacterium]